MSASPDTVTDSETGRPPSVSVIMPVYNGSAFISQSLPPLISMRERGEISEIIVVDDSSTDDSAALAERLGATVIRSGGRLGPGGARNQAANIASGELLWFIDADVVVHDDAASHIMPVFSDPNTVAAFGSYDDQPAAQNFLSQYKNLVHHFYHRQGRRQASTFWSGCGVIRKAAFLEQQGFDLQTYTRPSIEDIELGYRLRQAGGSIRLVPDCLSTHLKDWRLGNLLYTEVFSRALPWSRLMLRNTGVIDDLNVGAAERLRALIALLFWAALLLSVIGVIGPWLPLLMLVIAGLCHPRLYGLFLRKRGLLFMLAGILFHQLYYLYSSATFVYCYIEAMFRRRSQ